MTGPYRASNLSLLTFLYTADAIAWFLPKRWSETPEDRPLRVLVANWAHMGDIVTVLPLLKHLETHPRVQKLGVLIASWSRPILEASDIKANIHVIDHWSLDRSDRSTWRKVVRYLRNRKSLIKDIRAHRYDVSIDTFSTFPSSHAITWSAFIPRRIGFKSGGLGNCLTDAFVWVPDDRLMLHHQLELLRPVLGEQTPKHLAASYPGFNSAHLVAPPQAELKPYIVFHMGPRNFRQWRPEKWAEVAIALEATGFELLATGGPGDEVAVARELGSKVRIRNLAGRQSWGEFVATLANASAVITIDSVAGHVAACFGVPTIVLAAGRQRLGLWRPNNSGAIMLTHQVGCAPCHRASGCAAMACIQRIEVGKVLSSLHELLGSRSLGEELLADGYGRK